MYHTAPYDPGCSMYDYYDSRAAAMGGPGHHMFAASQSQPSNLMSGQTMTGHLLERGSIASGSGNVGVGVGVGVEMGGVAHGGMPGCGETEKRKRDTTFSSYHVLENMHSKMQKQEMQSVLMPSDKPDPEPRNELHFLKDVRDALTKMYHYHL